MNIIELSYKGRTYHNIREILDILKSEKLYWLIDSETDAARIKIENSTVIWNEGTFISGDWKYGIFKNGGFYGNWENGIFEDGYFNGNWKSGINLKKNNF